MASKAAAKIVPMVLGSRSTFEKNGKTMNLTNPDGPPSDSMLWSLHKNGYLVIVAEPVEPFTKGQASFALDVVLGAKAS